MFGLIEFAYRLITEKPEVGGSSDVTSLDTTQVEEAQPQKKLARDDWGAWLRHSGCAFWSTLSRLKFVKILAPIGFLHD